MTSERLAVEDGPRCSLQLHGTPALRMQGRLLPIERKAAGVLAWLALRGPTARDRLAENFWARSPAEAARNNLRQLIFKLKKLAGTAVIAGQETLSLSDGVTVAADGDLPLLEGLDYSDCAEFGDWLAAQREAARAEASRRGLAAFDDAEARGDLAAAHAIAQSLVQADPLSDAAQQRWIRALYWRGDVAQALEAGLDFARRLQDELGLDPSEETRRLIDGVRTHAMPARPGPAPRRMPVTLLRPPRLVGRDEALRQLARIRADRGLPLVVGEAGLGKSRLVAEVAGPDDVVASARSSDAAVPYATLARLVRQVAQRFPASVDALAPAWRARLAAFLPTAAEGSSPDAPADEAPRLLDRVHAIAALLAAAAREGLGTVWLDDLHFADAATGEALPPLVDESTPSGVSFALASRPAEGDRALAAWVDRSRAEGRVQAVSLGPLGVEAIRDLVASLGLPEVDDPSLPEALLKATGGNPLFILETLKQRWAGDAAASASGLPRAPSVLSLIARRLARLSSPALNLARVAALAGPDFSVDLAVHVLHRPALDLVEAWHELQQAQVLREDAFAHDLILEATLADVPQPLQRHARGAIAAYLETRDGEPARIAAHWVAAGDEGRAARHFEAAARRAERAIRYVEARAAMARAVECHERAGRHDESLRASVALADLMKEHGQAQEAADWLLALEHQQSHADDRLLVASEYIAALSWLDLGERAIAHGESLLRDEDLMQACSPARRAGLHMQLSNLYRVLGRPAPALAHIQQTAAENAAHPDPQQRGWHHADVGACLRDLGRFAEARPRLLHALECARTTGRHRMIAGVLQSLAQLEHLRGALLPALETAQDALRWMSDADGETPFGSVMNVQAGREEVQLGRLAAGAARLEAALAQDHLPTLWRAHGLAWLARAWRYLGRTDAAREVGARLDALPGQDVTVRLGLDLRVDLGRLEDSDVGALFGPDDPFAGHRAASRRWRLLRAWTCPGAEPATALARLADEARDDDDAGMALLADLALLHLNAREGLPTPARACGERALGALRRVTVPGLYRGTLWLSIHDALATLDPALAQRAARDGADWVRALATFHLPEPSAPSFLGAHAVNRRLLALAGTADVAGHPRE